MTPRGDRPGQETPPSARSSAGAGSSSHHWQARAQAALRREGAWYCAEIAAVFPKILDVFLGMSNVF